MSRQVLSALTDFVWKTTQVALREYLWPRHINPLVPQQRHGSGAGVRGREAKFLYHCMKWKRLRRGKHGLTLVEWKYLHKGTTLFNSHMVHILPNTSVVHTGHVTFLSFLMGFFFFFLTWMTARSQLPYKLRRFWQRSGNSITFEGACT